MAEPLRIEPNAPIQCPCGCGLFTIPAKSSEMQCQDCGVVYSGIQIPIAGYQFMMEDLSEKTFGKYQHCTMYMGQWYADSDFDLLGVPKWGAVPAPGSLDVRPWHGLIAELWRRCKGAPRADPRR